jgi:hypothetical protein
MVKYLLPQRHAAPLVTAAVTMLTRKNGHHGRIGRRQNFFGRIVSRKIL